MFGAAIGVGSERNEGVEGRFRNSPRWERNKEAICLLQSIRDRKLCNELGVRLMTVVDEIVSESASLESRKYWSTFLDACMLVIREYSEEDITALGAFLAKFTAKTLHSMLFLLGNEEELLHKELLVREIDLAIRRSREV